MKIAVFGGGYAGVTLVRELEDRLDDDVELVLVDETGDHLVQHELHRVIRIPEITEEIVIDLETITERATVVVDRVEAIDPAAGRAELADGTVEYDIGAVCLGAQTNFYDIPGLEAHAIPLKRVDHARKIRDAVFDALETRTKESTPRIVVGGAGLSGIQAAGELAALVNEHDLEVGQELELTLVEQANAIAPRFGESFQTAVHDALDDRGVTIRTGQRVTEVTESTVELDEESIEYDTLVWTGGIRGPDALDGERPVVDARLQLDGSTFVIGDAAAIVDRDGEAVAASAQAAVRSAKAAAENIDRLVEYERTGGTFRPRLQQFQFDSPGWLVSVGDGAVAQVGPTVLTGRAAVAMKTTVGAGYLSSVGAIEQAVDLVNDELGLDVGDEE